MTETRTAPTAPLVSQAAGLLCRALIAGSWCVAAGLSVLLAGRLLAWDRWQPLVVADACINFVLFPAWLIALLAILLHRRALAVLACVLVVGHLAVVMPELTARTALPALADTAGMVIFDANVYENNPSMSGFAATIEKDSPDVIALEEATPTHRQELVASGALRSYPYQFDVPRDDSRGFLLASRLPLTNTRVVEFEGSPLVVQTNVTISGRTIGLWVVHTVAPVGAGWQQWSRQLSALSQMVKDQSDQPLVVVGDFNATWGNRQFRKILAAGMTDAAAARGNPFEMTWSKKLPVLPPLVRIDHVLTNDGIVISHIKDGPGPGSDHRSLIVKANLT